MSEHTVNGKAVCTPELDKRQEVIASGQASTAQDFLDWLRVEKGVVFAKWGKPYEVALVARFRRGEVVGNPVWRSFPWDGDLAGNSYVAVNPSGERVDEPIIEVRENEDALGIHDLTYAPGEQVLAEFFGIDQAEVDAEQRAILDALREAG